MDARHEARRARRRRHLPAAVLACSAAWLCARDAQRAFSIGSAGSPAFLRTSRVKLRASAAPVGAAAGDATLRYFDGRGVAETARLLFAVAGEKYEDMRYPISFGTPGDFSTLKRDEFLADKEAGKFDINMGKVPVLEVGSAFRLPQSKAIERYLARKFGMMGSTPEEEAWVDAMAEHVRDINDAYNRKGITFMKDEEKKAELTRTWFDEELPELLGKFEKALPGTSAGFAVGNKMSYADVTIFKLLKDTYQQDAGLAFADCPKLQAIVDNVAKTEGLQKWLEERPKTMF